MNRGMQGIRKSEEEWKKAGRGETGGDKKEREEG